MTFNENSCCCYTIYFLHCCHFILLKDDGNEHLITVSSQSFGKAAFAAETALKYYKPTP